MALKSSIYRGEVTHLRLGQTAHAFTYPMTFFAFDVSELETLDNRIGCFGYNTPELLRINDKDYLAPTKQSIEKKLDAIIGRKQPGQRTLLVTSPRFFNYAFNPVNFHLRIEDDELLAVVAEVNNTFGDRHVYPLKNLEKTTSTGTWVARCPKDFHVSPFNDLNGIYHFTFRLQAESIFLGVDLFKDNECTMKTWIKGTSSPLTAGNIYRYALLHPFDTALNSFPRILYQAAILHFRKKLRTFKRPSPFSRNTIIDRDSKENRKQTI